MKSKLTASLIGLALLVIILLILYKVAPFEKEANPSQIPATLANPVSVDEVARYPDRFRGSISVVGKVTKIDGTGASFILGCDDACVSIPVAYKGTMPKTGSDITVYGQVMPAGGGRYIFEGRGIK